MGIRVHKVLGYGLTDVREGDDRINWESPLLSYDSLSGEQYLRWLHGKLAGARQAGNHLFSLDLAMLQHSPKLRKADLRNRCITWNAEYGLKNVLVITPLGVKGWERYDDSIDYMEETYLKPDGQRAWVCTFQHGIHPFNGVYMDAETGEQLPADIMTWVRIRSSADQQADSDSPMSMTALDELTCELTAFSGFEEANERVVPSVPEEVRDIAAYGSLFTGELTWAQLRPLLYTYWA